MGITVTPRAETFFAEVDGVDLTAPMTRQGFAEIEAAFHEHGVLLFRDQFINDEQQVAFSEFFGGFPSEFYAAYEQAWPLPAGYDKRKLLYNLYHVLNHANLFGGGYAGQAKTMIGQLL